jgi:tetratricopeptide (TPR) repeat protein/CHAT domain-containing protein
MMGRSLRRAAALIIFAVFAMWAVPTAKAQRSDDLETLNRQVERLYQGGKYAEATEIAERAVNLAEQKFGRDHPDVVMEINNLSELYRARGRYDEAELLYKRALAIDNKAFGPNHLSVGRDLNGLAGLYGTQGRYDEAELHYNRALAIAEKALGPDDPNVGTALNNLAWLYDKQGRYDEAERHYNRALAIAEKALGPEHPDVGRDLNNLASLYVAQGHYREAEPLYERARAIDEKALGPEHPDVGRDLNNLAWLYRAQGRYADAEQRMKRALAIQEKALGRDHPTVGTDLGNLAVMYRDEGRDSEAEPLMKRALAIAEKALGPYHTAVGTALGNLGQLYCAQRRYAEAEPLYTRALAIYEKALGPDRPDVAIQVNNLAELYRGQGRYDEAELLYKRALAIYEKALGPDHPNIGLTLNNLALLYQAEGRYADAEQRMKRALAIAEKALGPDHPTVSQYLNNLVGLYFPRGDWARAAEYWRHSTDIIKHRAQLGTFVVDQALTGKRRSEAELSSSRFWGLVKALSRLSSEEGTDTRLPSEMFETAQWAQSSEAAESLSQMAARGAKGDPKLPALVRERQDLVAEWQKRDAVHSASVAQAPNKRNAQAEAANIARLAAIDTRIADIDKQLVADFPQYFALASPAPLSVEDVQRLLDADEALVLFLETPEAKPTPEETFIWVVTKDGVRWARSELGKPSLAREVAALRCGLDLDDSWISLCSELFKVPYSALDYSSGKPLPFDLARANKLYKALFGQIENVIKDKRLLIVPSGPLTQLPFHVLVQSLPSDVSAVERSREVARLGVRFFNLTDDERKRLQLKGDSGVRIGQVLPDSAAEAAGLRPEDIVLSFDGAEFAIWQKLTEAIQAHAPGAKVQMNILRDGAELTVTATLGATTIREWIPRLLANGEGKSVAWLAREHAITVLPAVSSLKALRQYAKQSRATLPYIGFGNPLLDGEPAQFPDDGERAKLAREKHCDPLLAQSLASSLGAPHRTTRAIVWGDDELADIVHLKHQAPLPETADELCEVAHDLGVDPAINLYIGAKATEAELKQLSDDGTLAKYKIIHFATHGTLAGELSSSAEPGLILTPPNKATDTDDGYLTASEIAALKVDADWVILSACNTAGGDAKSAEALSGLARAFFYAGARSLLVSHWEVNSNATVKLITQAVAELKADPNIGRAEALRRSMLSMIAHGVHPAFWAPFVLVGEGSAAR